jgi:serine/threonine protein kinase
MSSSLPARVGRYEVVDRLGTGGMGVVYLATDPLLRRTVAVKVLPGENDDMRERFAREGRSAAALRHNNIVTIYDVGEDNGQPFIAMEFIDGESMSEMIRRRAPLPLPRRLQLMVELCAGLGYAHRSGIIHRDIKPANLMITTEGGLKILDFGLARVVAEPTLGPLTGVGTLLGTPHYLAPEQIAGTPGDRLSDIFSTGLVLYECISYRKAYPGDSGPAILFDIVAKEPMPIRELVPEIDDELESIVTHAVEKTRERRYTDLGVLGDALERVRARLARSDSSVVPRKHKRKPGAALASQSTEGLTPHSKDPRLDAIAQKRAAQIAEHLAAAAAHLQSGQYLASIEHCEHALMLDPDDEQGLELLRQAHRAIEDAQVRGWIDEARAQLERGALTEAEQLIEQSLRVRADQPELQTLQDEVKERRRERERQLERQRSAQAAVERAHRNMDGGALDAVVRSASEALAYDPGHAEARELKTRAIAMLEERRRQQERVDAGAEAVQIPLDSVEHRVDEMPSPRAASNSGGAATRAAVSRPASASVSSHFAPRAVGPSAPLKLRNQPVLIAAGVLVLAVIGALVALSRSAGTPRPVVSEVPVAPTAPAESLAEQNAARYRDLLRQAEDHVAGQDADGAATLIQEAEQILAGDPRLDELKKQVDAMRAAALKAEQQRDDIEQALAQAAKMSSDTDALARLQRELAKYPGAPELSAAVAVRTKARDDKIADLLRRAESASDEQAVALLKEALRYNAARVDVRRELDRRSALLSAANTARPARPPASREEVEDDVRQALYDYQAAYASRSVEDFLKLAPFRTRAQVEAEFSRFRTIQLNIEGITIDLDPSSTHASVKCTISRVSIPNAPNAKPMMDKRAWQFQLTYTGGVWQITRADPR